MARSGGITYSSGDGTGYGYGHGTLPLLDLGYIGSRRGGGHGGVGRIIMFYGY